MKNKYRNVSIIHQENKGPGAARNKGIEIANGKYIGFMDVDDSVTEDMYEKLYKKSEKYNLDMVVCGQQIIDSNGNIKEIIIPKYSKDIYKNRNEIREYILKRILINGPELLASQCNKIYKKSIIKKYKIRVPENRYFGEDWFFNQLMLSKVNKVGFLMEPLYKYIRSNADSLSSVYLNNAFDIFVESYKFKKCRMKEWKLNNRKYELIENKNFCDTIYKRVIVNEMSKKNNISLVSKFNNIKNYILNERIQYAANNCNNSRYSRMYSKKRILTIFIFAYFDENIRPYLSKIKKIVT